MQDTEDISKGLTHLHLDSKSSLKSEVSVCFKSYAVCLVTSFFTQNFDLYLFFQLVFDS